MTTAEIIITLLWLLFAINLLAPKTVSKLSQYLIEKIKHLKEPQQ